MTNKNLEDIFMSYLKKIPEDLKLGEKMIFNTINRRLENGTDII